MSGYSTAQGSCVPKYAQAHQRYACIGVSVDYDNKVGGRWWLRGGGGGGLRSGSVKSNSEKLRKIAGNLRCRNQTSRSLKGQRFCTGDTQGTNKHARWTRKNCGKTAENCENCEIAKNSEKLRTSIRPPLMSDGGCRCRRHHLVVLVVALMLSLSLSLSLLRLLFGYADAPR